ncbi:DUF2252 domain-containing protein [Nocardioides sp. WV_118_6]
MTPSPVHAAPPAEQRARGRELRSVVGRERLAELEPAADRDPVAVLAEQDRGRLSALVPVRHERMAESPFAYFRGAAAVMAADLATTPSTGVHVQACGDAHLSNFGVFAARDRSLVFDVNDFDETTPGPWEWDVKRLVTSVVLAGRQQQIAGPDVDAAAEATARAYRLAVRNLAKKPAMARYYERIDAATLRAWGTSLDERQRRIAEQGIAKARRNTSERALKKLTVTDRSGVPRIVDQPPLVTRLPELDQKVARSLAEAYLRSVPPDVAGVLQLFRFQDAALKVVGVGSVGTRCLLVLMTDPTGDPLFLQLKEATTSVLERHVGANPLGTPAERVVAGQLIMQASSDPFLGWFTAPDGRSYYVRQFRDMKGSLDLGLLDAGGLARYGELCASTLARAHSQLGAAATIGAYLGKSRVADQALAAFGQRYADRTEADHGALGR